MEIERIELDDVYGHEHTELDLSDTGAAVVCGDNGAGKSTLVAYGPLWALYGRKAVQGDTYRDVVRHGAERARAVVDFRLGGDLFRVIRTYSTRTKSGASTLEFLRREPDDWNPVDSGSISEVEQSIVDVIGVDFETFTTGTVQTQGDSGRFTSATSSERIEILSKLLGVDYLRDAFTESGRRLDRLTSEVESKQSELSDLRDKRERAEDLREEIDDLESELEDLPDLKDTDTLEDQIEDRESDLERVVEGISHLEDLVVDERELSDRVSDLERELSELRSQYAAAESKVQSADVTPEDLEIDAGEIDDRIEQLEDSISDARQARDALQDARKDEQRREVWIEDLQETREEIPDRIDEHRETIREIIDREDLPVVTPSDGPDAFVDVRKQLDLRKTELQSSIDEIRERSRELKEMDREYRRNKQALDDRIERLRDRAETIDERNEDVPAEKCRDCGLLESAFEARDELAELDRSELRAERRGLVDAVQSFQFDLREYHPRQVAEIDDVERLEATDVVDALEDEISRLERAQKSAERCEQIADDVSDLESRAIKTGRKLQEHREELESARETIESIVDEYDLSGPESDPTEAVHRRIGRWESAKTVAEQRERLETMESAAEDLKSEIERLESRRSDLHEYTSKMGDLRERRDDIREDVREIREDLESAREHNESVRERRETVQSKIDRLEGKVEGIEDDLGDVDDLQSEIEQLRDDVWCASKARKFFDAAPNVAVSAAVPRLEAETNDVLEDVFPGTRIEVRRQDQTADGDYRDKLTLSVRRHGAEQVYTAFSGGEQFLLDVSIRLGLARAASAESAGHPLDLLIVDEGFGALDDANVSRVQDALRELAGRFGQILVISHVEDVKHTFGSVIEVSEGGVRKS